MSKLPKSAIFRSALLWVFSSLAPVIPAYAHNGPPFPIVEKKHVGQYVIDLWTHPDLGYGTFFVIIDPAPGTKIPNDLKAQVAVQPENRRLPEKVYDMWRDPVRDQVQFDQNRIEFDHQEYWRVRLILESSAGTEEVLSRVVPTPTGLGKWDLVLYALPFLFVAFMWNRGMARRRKLIKKHTAKVAALKTQTGAIALGAIALLLTGCSRSKVPAKDSPQYQNAARTFYVGLAALQVGNDARADSELAKFVQLAPGEPAGWGNWGMLALRQRNYDAAADRLKRAQDLAPKDGHIKYLQGLLESGRGNSTAAIDDLRSAVELDPQNLRAAYQLAEEVERQGGANSDAQFQQIIENILKVQPNNLAALAELARIQAKRSDQNALRSTVTQIAQQSGNWPPEVKQQLSALQTAAAGSDTRAAATRTVFLKNTLMRVPEYRQALFQIKAPPGDEAQPFTHFVRMESPTFTTAEPDTSISFAAEPVVDKGGHWDWVGAISLGGSAPPTLANEEGGRVHLATGATFPFPGGAAHTPPSPEGILPIDFNYDFKQDLVLTGAGGIRFLRQDTPSAFTDVTAATKLPKAVLNGKYSGAWAVDIEADGDLDIVLGTAEGLPTVLRNNGDSTFTPIHPFAGISGVREMCWVDLEGDGNPDAAIVDGAGHLHVFMNQRQGQFAERALASLPVLKAMAVADADGDGVLDLIAVESDGSIVRISAKGDSQNWDVAQIATVPNAAEFLNAEVRLYIADLDNNGALDLILARVVPSIGGGAYVWLGSDQHTFTLLDHPVGPPAVLGVADVNSDGRLDLIGLSANAYPVEAINHGTKNYHWQIVRPHAAQAAGDQRINPFGIGGEVEVSSGLQVQKQPITGPDLHFGLGEQTTADVIRVVWPNGSVRAEFDAKADQPVVTEQRLKGSCPFLFAYNGKRVEFVKDAVPWSSAIGLRINTIGTARVEATEEWYKIRADQLVPRNGYYDLRFTAELWETYYYDYLNLMTVDHPAGTDIFVDERFVIPPAELAITTVETPHPIARAVDDNGQDVTDTLRTLDGKYLDTFGRGQYQGVTRDHYVEIDLGDDVPANGPLVLIAQGWMHPTDSSINVAIAQGNHEPAKGLSLEVPDGRGGWTVARKNLGFPAGRKKICLFELTNIFRPGRPHKLRLRTNLEIYWDKIEWAKVIPNAQLKITRIAPQFADLHYRGYSVINQVNPSSPELPDYNHLEGSKQRYRDLVGYYTRYGDVRELLDKIDDRYVIMNSGDEMTLRFAEQPEPEQGRVRDYIIAGDGWIKDGDYNSTFSKTVLPLPYHAKNLYIDPPGRLKDEWVYKHHPEDWENYQTRYVTPEVFENALRTGVRP
ncbi:MAG TPA: FG-GAP-like repeat-containing protein [Terriglobales bacterium]|nr:FG-GAP-like repeat-containing protein [Terriglobales bacterium]